MEEVVELRGLDPCDRVFAAQQPLLDHRDRGPHRGGCRPLCRPGLQEIQPALFDRELDVLNVAVVVLEPLHRVFELVERSGERRAHLFERDGATDTGDHVLTLRIQEKLAADAAFAGRGVAAEADTGSAIAASVPEHHPHHVDGGPEVLGNLVGLPVHPSTRRVPGVEDGAHGAHQLLVCVDRECVPRLLLVDLLVARDQELQVRGCEVDVVLDTALRSERCEGMLEAVRVDAVDDLSVHLDQAPVRVLREPIAAGCGSQPPNRLVIESEIKDRIHHPRHRDRGARTNREEQRIRRAAEGRAGGEFQPLDVVGDLLLEADRQVAVRQECAARVGGDREPFGHRYTEMRHLGQPETLAAEQFSAAGRGLVEGVHEARSRPGVGGHGRHGALLSKM